MTQTTKQPQTVEALKVRLDEIVEQVNDETLPLDQALDLYEEAVSLGLQVSHLLEQDIANKNAELDNGSTDEDESALEEGKESNEEGQGLAEE